MNTTTTTAAAATSSSSYYHQQQQQQLKIMSHSKLLYKGYSESLHAFFVGHWYEVNLSKLAIM
jgi:hypothetical protein